MLDVPWRGSICSRDLREDEVAPGCPIGADISPAGGNRVFLRNAIEVCSPVERGTESTKIATGIPDERECAEGGERHE